jgi:hypothetical protein
MSLTITQNPATASLAQSPMVFTLSESTAVINSSSFQYYADLYYWTGSLSNSGSISKYTLVKYPNNSGVGIFDVSKIMNSTLTDLRQTNPSNVEFYKINGYWKYVSGSSYISSSKVGSDTFKALDGYGIFQEAINGPVYDKSPYWPLMSDGPVTQSFFAENTGTMGVYVSGAGKSATPTKVTYVSNLGTADINVSSSNTTSTQIQQVPLFPTSTGFPFSSIGLEWYTLQAFNGASALAPTIRYEFACQQKYPNVRIKWKNRYGQFDYFNFYMVSKKAFKTEKRTYQPQIGSWDAATLTYQNYDSQNLNYLSDSSQTMSVNTFWIPEQYNDILKQLMVSDEIYYVTTESTDILTPITINTDTITFKTGVVDGLIQYAFDFRYGQNYKLII